MFPPFNLKKWIDENRNLLKPPVGNHVIYPNTDFMIMIVGGPNQRADYHVNEGEEFFYQVEGDIELKLKLDDKFETIKIREGEIFLLPPNIPHGPQRPANTVGLVIEKQRNSVQKDGFQWYCDQCKNLLHEEFFHLKNIVSQLPPIFENFYSDPKKTTCHNCGLTHAKN